MRPRLNRTLKAQAPRYPERALQFGGGNFLRGFVDWVVDILNEETDFAGGIVLVKATPGRYLALEAQDGLFTTYLHGVENGEFRDETRLISAVTRTVYPYEDFAAYLALARQPEIRFIFSNTTEAGIIFAATDAFSDQPPASFPAKLTRFLYERYQHFQGRATAGCIIIPTELIVDNASRLREIILQYAALWQLEPGFADWLAAHNRFCNTLVDRIIPGFPANADAIFTRLGYEDRLLVAGERYHSWIIEAPPSLLEELPTDKTRRPLNVKIVSDATPHRTIKVRLLNGAHTSMVPLGLLLGIDAVRPAVEHAVLGPFLEKLLWREIIPSVRGLPQSELEAFASAVLDRFRNPHIDHYLLTIALNSAAKVKERILPSLLGYQARTGALPPRLTLALAAFIRLYRGEWQGAQIPLKDAAPTLAWFQEQWRESSNMEVLARAVLGNAALWGQDLGELPGLAAELGAYLEAIEAGRLLELLRDLA